MNKEKRKQRVSRGKARWHAARLEGKQKNLGITNTKKQKGDHKETRRRKVVKERVSKRKTSQRKVTKRKN